jgi:tetratricopeptide (TPR) repeat protein
MTKRELISELEAAFEHINNNQIDAAKDLYNSILAQNPDCDVAHHMVSFAHVLGGNLELATKHIEKAIELYKCSVDYYNTAASIYRDQGLLEKALEMLQTTLSLKKDNPETYNNFGLVLNDMGNYGLARTCFETGILHDPDAAYIHFNYALSLLKLGEYREGWKEYEWRHKLTGNEMPKIPTVKELQNSRVVIHHEQGFGDNIQFIRYAKLLKELGCKVNLIVSHPLEKLMQHCPHIDTVNAEDMMFDHLIPMMSLPHIFETTLENIPPTPVFKIPTKKTEGFNIGLVWNSKKHASQNTIFREGDRILPSLPALAYKSAQRRLLKAEWFHAISTLPVKLWCLQPDTEINVPFIHPLELDSFYDTAEAIQQMDLVITIDTAATHLAASLNVPTWLILPYDSEWRWLAGRSDSPWYPSLKIIQQKERNEWEPVFGEIHKMLIDMI